MTGFTTFGFARHLPQRRSSRLPRGRLAKTYSDSRNDLSLFYALLRILYAEPWRVFSFARDKAGLSGGQIPSADCDSCAFRNKQIKHCLNPCHVIGTVSYGFRCLLQEFLEV